MNDRDFDNYLALLTGLLRLRKPQQSAIAQELRDHLVEHVAHLEESGVAHDEAVRLALAEFGDAAALAANFSQLVRTRRRRLMMRLTVGSACVLVGLAIGIVVLRPNVPDRSQRLVAQDTPKAAGAFDEVVKSVLGAGAQAAAGAPASSNEQTRQRLAAKMDADFVDTPLADVLEFIADTAGVQFYFDQQKVQEDAARTAINFHLKAVPAEMVLELICRRTGLGYRLRHGVILISNVAELPYEPEVRVYMVPEPAVEELAMLIPAMIDVHSWRQPIVIAAGGYGANFSAPVSATAPISGGPPGMVAAAPNRNDGTIQVFRGALVISQTAETHQKIEKLLDDLKPVLDKKPTAVGPTYYAPPNWPSKTSTSLQSVPAGVSPDSVFIPPPPLPSTEPAAVRTDSSARGTAGSIGIDAPPTFPTTTSPSRTPAEQPRTPPQNR